MSIPQLRSQLDALVDLCDVLTAHLEREREQAAHRGARGEAKGLQRGLLQVARVRNDVRSACHDLDAVSASGHHPIAA